MSEFLERIWNGDRLGRREYRFDRTELGILTAALAVGLTDPFAGPRLWTDTDRLKGVPHYTPDRPLTKRQRRRIRGKARAAIAKATPEDRS